MVVASEGSRKIYCDVAPFWKNGSSRGTSRRHDVLDTVIKLERPYNYTQQEGAKFEVHFGKGQEVFQGVDAKP